MPSGALAVPDQCKRLCSGIANVVAYCGANAAVENHSRGLGPGIMMGDTGTGARHLYQVLAGGKTEQRDWGTSHQSTVTGTGIRMICVVLPGAAFWVFYVTRHVDYSPGLNPKKLFCFGAPPPTQRVRTRNKKKDISRGP